MPFAVTLRVPFRGVTVREGMVIQGPRGWGEFAPFDDYSDARAARWLVSAVEAAYAPWPALARSAVTANAIIPGVDASTAGLMAREAIAESGCTVIKVKVGSVELADDEARVVAVRDALDVTGGGAIRLDANGAWSPEQAIRALRRLGAYGIELVEQPCASLEDIAEVRRVVSIPIAVDECVRLASDPQAVSVKEAADYAVIKPSTLGGVTASMRVAESLGVPIVVSGSLDTSIGLATPLAFAGAWPDLPLASGVGTGRLLATDLVEQTLVPRRGSLPVVHPAPDLDRLLVARDAVPTDRVPYWWSRLKRAWHAGADRAVERWLRT
ncbi:MAG: O-succinylbenzoate synthase [Actinobacteria bacterium]|nr:O-succinylbenzoate synthase [Actinomycetota bacterium]